MVFSRKIMVIDPQQAGISGDMFLGALLGLGADKKIVGETIAKLSNYVDTCKSLELAVEETVKHGIRGVKATIKAEEKHTHRTGGELKSIAEKFLDESSLSKKAKNFVLESLLTLLKAEAKIHGSQINKLRLHETGSIDTLADLVGVAAALENLKVFKENMEVFSLPVCVGGGKTITSHGVLAVPAPATLEILTSKRFPFFGVKIGEELATPTGVALLTSLAKPVESYPLTYGGKVGYGAGKKDLEAIPNLLRVILGEKREDTVSFGEEIYVVETNVDDVDGETVGYLIEKLIESGVKDAYVIPAVGKKSRVVLNVKALTSMENMEKTINLIFSETGTLGVRVYPCKRFTLEREIFTAKVKIDDKTFEVRVKKAKDKTGKVFQAKPEYEDLKRIASETGKPLRKVREEVRKKVFIQ